MELIPQPPIDRVFAYYRRLRRVREFVESNYAEDISLAKAAQIAAMEATYFSTYFHKKVGIRFSDWLRRLRITKAVEMLRQEDHSITYIAYEVGFNDLRTFGRAFKQYTGLTPMKYRRRIRPDARQD